MEAPLMHLALVGTPNSGKTSLFNALTGSRQKVANYPGVTVERKEGSFVTPLGRQVSVVDLPGTYSLRGRSPDEEITRDMVLGRTPGEALPDLVLCVADSTNLRLTIRLLLELKSTGRPLMLVLNMFDIATRRGVTVDVARLSEALGVPVVTSDRGAQGRHRRIAAPDRRDRGAGATAASAKSLAAADGRAIAGHPARGRSHHRGDRQPAGAAGHLDRADRRRGAASGGGACDPGGYPVRDVPGGVRMGAAADGAVVVSLRRARATGSRHAARRPAAELPAERRDFRRRQRHRVPAADHHHLPVHPAAGRFRLHGARGVPDGPHHGRRRPARPRLHSAAVELRLRDPRHHGDARDRQSPRPADHHPDRAADDLFGADPGLHADHFRLHPRRADLGLVQSARPGDVRPLRGGHRQRARRIVPDQILHVARLCAGAVHAGTAGLQDAAPEEHRHRRLHAGEDVPAARRHHDLLDDGADLVSGVVSASRPPAPTAPPSTTAWPP